MAITHARGIDFYHEVAGEGPPVLLISGTGADLRNVPHDRHPLARHFETHAYDQRGLGQTSKPDEPYTMADYADDAAGLLHALGVDHAHVVPRRAQRAHGLTADVASAAGHEYLSHGRGWRNRVRRFAHVSHFYRLIEAMVVQEMP